MFLHSMGVILVSRGCFGIAAQVSDFIVWYKVVSSLCEAYCVACIGSLKASTVPPSVIWLVLQGACYVFSAQ